MAGDDGGGKQKKKNGDYRREWCGAREGDWKRFDVNSSTKRRLEKEKSEA